MRNIILLLMIVPFMVFGQHRCMSDEYNVTKTFSHERSTIPDNEVDLDSKYKINIVFHIIYKVSETLENQNISDDDIEYAVACLNRDFNLLNADTSILTDTLKLLPGNMNIEFELASVDPDGNPTNGITRTETNNDIFSYYTDGAKFDSLGGHDAWDTKRYYNVWVCRLQNGIIGYSQFPGGDDNTDGVVILNDVVRENPSSYPRFNKGRVLAHEIGHSLSLRHPWGNCYGCCNNLVDDIPTQNGPNYSCGDTVYSLCDGNVTRDVVKHYMDYCGDSCMVMFTKGQVFNARKSIQEYRMDLVEVVPVLDTQEVIIDDIKIYPTINTGRLFIELNGNFDGEEVIFHLYDMTNRLVQRETLIGGVRNNINLDIYANGLYSVVLFVGEDIRFKDRIIYNHDIHNKIKKDDDIEEIINLGDER